MRKVRSLLKAWGFRFFGWRIDVKLTRLDGDDRILYLANLLMDECERQGHDTVATDKIRGVNISYHNHLERKYPDLHIRTRYGSDDWNVKGYRTA